MTEQQQGDEPWNEQAQVGDTVRLTITTEGVVRTDQDGRRGVGGWLLDGPNCEVEILSRAPLPNKPGTLWMDRWRSIWEVTEGGILCSIEYPSRIPEHFAPFRQLVFK